MKNEGQSKRTVFFIGAHPDDTEGFAGTAFLLAGRYDVHVVDFTHGERGLGEQGYLDGTTAKLRTAEEGRAMEYLGASVHFLDEIDGESNAGREAAEAIAALVHELDPVAVFTHWPLDTHPDHVQTYAAVMWALSACERRYGIVPELYFYEVLPEQTRLFPPLYYVDITDVIEKKLTLLRMYECQNEGDALAMEKKRNAADRGAERVPAVGYAECFSTLDGEPLDGGILSTLPQTAVATGN